MYGKKTCWINHNNIVSSSRNFGRWTMRKFALTMCWKHIWLMISDDFQLSVCFSWRVLLANVNADELHCQPVCKVKCQAQTGVNRRSCTSKCSLISPDASAVSLLANMDWTKEGFHRNDWLLDGHHIFASSFFRGPLPVPSRSPPDQPSRSAIDFVLLISSLAPEPSKFRDSAGAANPWELPAMQIGDPVKPNESTVTPSSASILDQFSQLGPHICQGFGRWHLAVNEPAVVVGMHVQVPTWGQVDRCL